MNGPARAPELMQDTPARLRDLAIRRRSCAEPFTTPPWPQRRRPRRRRRGCGSHAMRCKPSAS